jgi:serine/threonine-protein kinase
MFWTRADGSGQPQQLIPGNSINIPWSFSPDGKRMAFMERSGTDQILTVEVEEQGGQLKAGKPEPFLKDSFNDTQPSFSPDGKWLAYTSTEVGSVAEVYVRRFPPPASGQGGKWVISNQGGQSPIWSRTGHDLLYQASGGQIMAASYAVKGDTFVADKPRVWLERPGSTDFDLSPDGKRVAVVAPVAGTEGPKPEHEVAFLQNFFDELRRRVPLNGK